MRARFASANFYISGENVYSKLAPFLKSIRYSDSLENEADTVEITLADPTHNLLQQWKPARGTEVFVELVKTSWNSRVLTEELPQEILPLGTFETDEIVDSYPPSQCVIKLNSVPNKAKVRNVNKDKSWEQVNLSKIARDIANDAGLRLFYDVPDDPEIKRVEQSGESDLALLKRLCSNYGLNLKVHDGKLIIFDAETYENKTPVFYLNYGDTIIKHFEGRATINQIYKDAQISFKSNNVADFLWELFGGADLFQGTSGVNLIGSFANVTSGAVDNVLNLNQKVNSEAEAKRIARKKLREKNKDEITVSLDLTGSFSFVAGNVFELIDFGIYSGRYLIDRSDHEMGGSGYTTKVEAHRCLVGY